MISVKGRFFGPSISMGSAPDWGGRANRARDAVGLSCASTPVQTDISRQLNRKNFLNMSYYDSASIGLTLSVCGWVLADESSKVDTDRFKAQDE